MTHTGIFIQEMFPFGAFGCRQWSLSEMKRLLRWLKGLEYNSVVFTMIPAFTIETDDQNILELGALFNSGLRIHAGFEPGNAYCPEDRILGTSDGLAKAERLKSAVAYTCELGMAPWVMMAGTIGTPQFCEDHPELLSGAGDSAVFTEGLNLCPSKPEALDYLLEHNARQLGFFGDIAGVALMLRDAGGCNCSRCRPQDQALVRLATSYHGMIKRVLPEAEISLVSWHIGRGEVDTLARSLPEGLSVFEAPRIHAMDVPWEEYIERVHLWKKAGRKVDGWIEVQENPTALLPTVYPFRFEKMIDLMKSMELEGIWGTAAQNPYLFPLNIWMLPKAWNGDESVEILLRTYLEESFGSVGVEPGLRYVKVMNEAWDLIQAQSQRDAGFVKIFVLTFPQRMLPERCIQNGVPEAFKRDLGLALEAATDALTAAEEFADRVREFRAADANAIAASAEVFYWIVRMRHAKIPVLDALHEGDAEEAVRRWRDVERAGAEIVAACRNSPNTDILANHWRKLGLLPARLSSLRRLLPELAERKTYRSIVQRIEMSELYHNNDAAGPRD